MVDFPAPVGPTMPMVWPEDNSNDTPLSTFGPFGYLKCTSSKVITDARSSSGAAPSWSTMVGSRSIMANTRRALASDFWIWLTSIPRMNSGIDIRVDISRKMTSPPGVMSPSIIR